VLGPGGSKSPATIVDTLVRIENFRCFPRLGATLRPLTVLVGPNDSGKSSFLAALRHLGQGIVTPSPSEKGLRQGSLELSIAADGPWGSAFVSTRETHVDAGIRPTAFFQLPSVGAPMGSPGYADTAGPQPLSENGTGVPSLMDYLLRRDRRRFDECDETMVRLVPGLRDVQIATPEPNQRRLDLVAKGVILSRPMRLRPEFVSCSSSSHFRTTRRRPS
jgi:hypothetical protein